MLVIYLALLPRGFLFGLGPLARFRVTEETSRARNCSCPYRKSNPDVLMVPCDVINPTDLAH